MAFDLIKFGKEIKRLRLNHNYTQARLAKKLEISVTHLSSIERGENTPSFFLLIKLTNLLDLSLLNLVRPMQHVDTNDETEKIVTILNCLNHNNYKLAKTIIETIYYIQKQAN